MANTPTMSAGRRPRHRRAPAGTTAPGGRGSYSGAALAAYRRAAAILPDSATNGELIYWVAVTLADIGRVDEAMNVPVQSVFRQGPVAFVYVQDGPGFAQRQVELGRASELQIEIRKGLATGDKVLLREPKTFEIASKLDPSVFEMANASAPGFGGGMRPGGGAARGGGAANASPAEGEGGSTAGASGAPAGEGRRRGGRPGGMGGPDGPGGGGRPAGGGDPATAAGGSAATN